MLTGKNTLILNEECGKSAFEMYLRDALKDPALKVDRLEFIDLEAGCIQVDICHYDKKLLGTIDPVDQVEG